LVDKAKLEGTTWETSV